MKVFINKRTGGYSGGLAVVAANNAEEAHKVFCLNFWNVNYFDKDGNYCGKEDAVKFDCYYYQPEKWEEVPCLTANVAEPTVITEDGYTE